MDTHDIIELQFPRTNSGIPHLNSNGGEAGIYPTTWTSLFFNK